MIGQVVGNYKIIRALGEGGVGMVYLAIDTMLDREVAIKVLRPELASQTAVVERFRSEAVTLAKLNHPNIATLYSLFRHGDHLLMVLEFINGETLDQILYRRRQIPTDEAIPYFCQALEGINYAHERGIVHRDIKPGNMMLTADGILKVLDFGIARLLGTNRLTRIGNVIGTLEYMSPEQVRGLETDARSDVYGLGIMLYEMLTGKLPFESENDFELMKMQTEKSPVPPRQFNPDIPVEVEKIIMKAVAKNPDYRFSSAGDFLSAFLEFGYAVPNFGTMHNFKKNSRPSNPGIQDENSPKSLVEASVLIPNNQAEIIGNTQVITINNNAVQSNEIKGTRLAPTNPNEIKATRFGDSTTENFPKYEKPEPASFLSKLNWLHFAVASAILLVFFGLGAMGIVLPKIYNDFFGAKVVEQPKNVENPKLTETPNRQTPTPTPEIVSQPKTEPTVGQIPTSTPTPIIEQPVITENPPTNKPNNPTQEQPKQRETVKNNPPPQQPKKTSPPPTPKQPKTTEKKRNLRDILTGN